MVGYTAQRNSVNSSSTERPGPDTASGQCEFNSQGDSPFVIVYDRRTTVTDSMTPEERRQLGDELKSASEITIWIGDSLQHSQTIMTILSHICDAVSDRGRFLTTDGCLLPTPLAALEVSAADLDDESKNQFINVAIQLAAAWWSDDLPKAVTEAAKTINAAGCRKPRDLDKKIKQAARRLRADSHECQRIADLITAPDVDPDLYVPRGWLYDRGRDCLVRTSGSVRGEEGDSLPGLLYVDEKSTEHLTGQQRMRLCWFSRGEVHRYSVQRQQLLIRRRVEELSALGLPVSSNNSMLCIAYFDDFLRENEFRFRTRRLVSQMGWVADTAVPTFVLGHETMQPADSIPDNVLIELDCSDPAIKKIAAAYRCGGDPNICRQLVSEVAEHSGIWLAILTTLSSVLLRPLQLPGCTLDVCGETTSCKTTTLLICASLFGDPDPDGKSESSTWHSWDITRVYAERWLAILRSLPVLLDDTRQLAKAEIVANVIYDIANGTNRGRGNETSLDVQLNWRLNAVSTGEQSLVSYVDQGGMRARIITLRGSLLPARNEEWRRRVEAWIKMAFANFGHIGRQFIQHVLDNYGDVERWKVRIDEIKRQLGPTFSTNAIVGRQLNYLALLTVTAELCCDWFGLPPHLRTPVESVRHLLQAEFAEADRPQEAMHRLLDHVTANGQLVAADRGYISSMDAGSPPRPSTFIGRWLVIRGDEGESLAIFGEQFQLIMKQLGYNKDEVLTAWMQRGWLHLEADGRVLKNIKFNPAGTGSQNIRSICIKAETILQMRASRRVADQDDGDPVPNS